MANILLILAVLGMIVGLYAVAMPTLVRRGWRLPFARFFNDADEGEDEAFTTAFEMPRQSDVVAEAGPAVPEPEPIAESVLPALQRPDDVAEEEDDPTLTPLFDGLDAPEQVEFDAPSTAPASAEPQHTVEPGVASAGLTFESTSDDSPFKTAAPASGSKPGPRFNSVEGASGGGGTMTDTNTQPGAEAAPAGLEPASGSDDMLSLFAEDADAGKGPNLIREAVGDVTIDDLMEEVRALRALLDKRAA